MTSVGFEDFGDWLRAGKADLAILPAEIATGDAGLRRAAVFEDRYVYVSDPQNPVARTPNTWTDLATTPHVGYGGDNLPSVGQRALAQVQGMHPHGITTQLFLLSGYLVQGTEFISLVPSRLAQVLKERFDVASFEPPTPLESMTETAYWGSRTDDDPAHRWLRQQLIETARTLDP